MPKFAGIDSSLTSTGLVTYDTDTEVTVIASFSSSNTGTSIANKHERLFTLASKVFKAATEGGVPELVAIEGPAFSSSTGKVWDRAGLWWYIVRMFIDYGCRVIEVPPTTRSKYGSGSGRAGKDEVLLAVSRTYPTFDIKNNDEADALVLCAFAARLSGHPFDGDLSKLKLDSLTKFEKDFTWEA